MRGEVVSDAHFAIAVRALPSGTLGRVGRTSSGRLRRCGEKLSGEHQQCEPTGVGEKSELPDSDEAPRQDVLGKAAEELRRLQSHLLLLVAMCVVFPAEGDLLSIKSEQAVIADGDAVGIASEITEYQGWGAECRLRIYDPLLFEK